MFEVEAAFRFFGALAFVVGLIVLLSYAGRRYRGLASGKLGRPRRLSIVEAVGVDAKRRLVLAQVDGREYVLLVGGGTDVLVEARDASPNAIEASADV
jgi:flagellar protein FliO/FliZ